MLSGVVAALVAGTVAITGLISGPAPTPAPDLAPVTASATTSTAIPLPWDPRGYDFPGRTGSRVGSSQMRELSRSAAVVRRDGEVLERVRTAAGTQLTVKSARDVQLRDCATAMGVRAVEEPDLRASVLIDRCNIDAQSAAGPVNGISGLIMTVRNSQITSNNDGITPTGGTIGPSLIEYNRITRDGSVISDRHQDGIQIWQGGNTVIRRNWITGWSNAAIIIKSDRELRPGDGPITNVTIEENYLAGVTHNTLYVRAGSKFGRPRFVTIRNNAFQRGVNPISAGSNPTNQAVFVRTEKERNDTIAAGNPTAAEWIVWSGNYWADNGQEITPPGGWRT